MQQRSVAVVFPDNIAAIAVRLAEAEGIDDRVAVFRGGENILEALDAAIAIERARRGAESRRRIAARDTIGGKAGENRLRLYTTDSVRRQAETRIAFARGVDLVAICSDAQEVAVAPPIRNRKPGRTIWPRIEPQDTCVVARGARVGSIVEAQIQMTVGIGDHGALMLGIEPA